MERRMPHTDIRATCHDLALSRDKANVSAKAQTCPHHHHKAAKCNGITISTASAASRSRRSFLPHLRPLSPYSFARTASLVCHRNSYHSCDDDPSQAPEKSDTKSLVLDAQVVAMYWALLTLGVMQKGSARGDQFVSRMGPDEEINAVERRPERSLLI